MKFIIRDKVVEGFQITDLKTQDHLIPDSGYDFPQWFDEAMRSGKVDFFDKPSIPYWGCIHTLSSGRIMISVNDWILTNEKGDIYTCKPNIFELTYERHPMANEEIDIERPGPAQ